MGEGEGVSGGRMVVEDSGVIKLDEGEGDDETRATQNIETSFNIICIIIKTTKKILLYYYCYQSLSLIFNFSYITSTLNDHYQIKSTKLINTSTF